MSRSALLVCAAVALSAGCKRTPPPQPRYCDQDLSGVWVNASDPAYGYRLEDHGESVRGKFFTMRVSSCQPDALQVVGETSYGVRDDCSRQKEEDGGAIAPRLTEYRWERPAGADGGARR
ncbi:MAG: hypothetical protein E6J64_06295 [Deltaproteobacteria bacterium]|nr:MAG: hypothetical protein E6J64_06295 [Deltaproteobacteria bacterium]